MITYDGLLTELSHISDICSMTECHKCPFSNLYNDGKCMFLSTTPNNWLDNMSIQDLQQFAQRGAQLVEDGYIHE